MTAVLSQPNNAAHERGDDGVIRAEDAFRRAAFFFAEAAKRLVESSTNLGPNTKVAHSALVDIEYARDLLGKLFMPAASKTPDAFADKLNNLTAEAVRNSVSKLAIRMKAPPVEPRLQGLYRPWGATDEASTATHNRSADLSAPVRPKQGKMLWAGVDCPVCPSEAGQRCRRDDGVFIEKPHPQRKAIVE